MTEEKNEAAKALERDKNTAGIIVDALMMAGILNKENQVLAEEIVTEEIIVRRAVRKL